MGYSFFRQDIFTLYPIPKQHKLLQQDNFRGLFLSLLAANNIKFVAAPNLGCAFGQIARSISLQPNPDAILDNNPA